MANIVKGKKVRCYYAETTASEKPVKICRRHFIHSAESKGLWAHIRDLTATEKTVNDAVGHSVSVQIIIGYNPNVLEKWEKLIFIDEQNRTYKLKTKPDEYEYEKTDLKLVAYAFKDETAYGGDVYD